MYIAPAIIACGSRYAKTATIAVKSFLQHHNEQLFVIADKIAKEKLAVFKNKNLSIIDIDKYVQSAMKDVNHQQFAIIPYDSDGGHNKKYSS